MAHPAKILKELKEIKPNASIEYWIFGIFHTSRSDKVDGFKGLLAASKEALIFKSGGSSEDSYILEIPLKEVKDVEADLNGTVNMVVHLVDGGYMEMSFISRGMPKEFLSFLKEHSENLQNEISTIENSKK